MTRLMVLGLLKTKPMSGYEMQQILQLSQTDRWAGILPGSIYHALKKMEKEGLVEIETLKQTGHRIKAIYKITEKGREEYRKLLKESLETPSVQLPSTLYTGLSFIRDLPREEIIVSLENQMEYLKKELQKQKDGFMVKSKHIEMDDITELTFQNIYKQYEIQIDMLKSLILYYEKKNETKG